MRFYPNGDVKIFWEIQPSWDLYTRTPNKSWKRRPLQPKHDILHWRDLDGVRKEFIMLEDLKFANWPEARIRWEACLPLYYSAGHRFIHLEKTVAGFKCTQISLNLKEVRELKQYLRDVRRERRRQAKLKKEMERLEKERLRIKMRKALP